MQKNTLLAIFLFGGLGYFNILDKSFLRDLDHSAGLLCDDAEDDRPEGPGQDDQRAAQAVQLVAVSNTKQTSLIGCTGYDYILLKKAEIN